MYPHCCFGTKAIGNLTTDFCQETILGIHLNEGGLRQPTPGTSYYQTNKKQTCILIFNALGFTTTNNTDEKGTRDVFSITEKGVQEII